MTCREMIMSEDFADILVDYDFAKEEKNLIGIPYCFQPLENELGIFYRNLAYTEPLQVSQYRYTYIPKCYGLMQTGEGDISYEQIGTFRAQRPPLSLKGKQVLMGFVDTGIRANLSAFQKEDGSSRIVAIWDQEDQEGVLPPGFLYGSEYLGDTEYREHLLKRFDMPGNHQTNGENDVNGQVDYQQIYLENIQKNLDPIGHGSAVASVAAGCAPDAGIVMVKCKQAKRYLRRYYAISDSADAYAESDLMTGVAYLKRISDALELPMVICITMGTNMGSHVAYSLFDRYLAYLGSRRGISIVIAGGNEGNQAHHYSSRLVAEDRNTFREVEIYVSENQTGFFMELWGSLPAVYTIALRSPDGEEIRRLPIRTGQTQEYSFIYNQTIVSIDFILVERASGQQLITLRFSEPLAGIWTLRVYMENAIYEGFFHVWLPITAFLNQPVYFLEPDPYETMTEPSYLDEAISLTYYDGLSGSFAIDSGRGYRDVGKQFFRRQVPDLSVPGIEVDTALGKRSGSSIAAGLACGCVAQFLEWAVTRGQDPLVNSKGVRNYFIRGCIRSFDQEYPSPTWGYGKLSLTGVFDVLRG